MELNESGISLGPSIHGKSTSQGFGQLKDLLCILCWRHLLQWTVRLSSYPISKLLQALVAEVVTEAEEDSVEDVAEEAVDSEGEEVSLADFVVWMLHAIVKCEIPHLNFKMSSLDIPLNLLKKMYI